MPSSAFWPPGYSIFLSQALPNERQTMAKGTVQLPKYMQDPCELPDTVFLIGQLLVGIRNSGKFHATEVAQKAIGTEIYLRHNLHFQEIKGIIWRLKKLSRSGFENGPFNRFQKDIGKN
jgi:hypothetical protein